MVRITKKNILEEASEGNLDVLNSEWLDKVQNSNGDTPLHLLAWKGVKEVLSHPSVDKVLDRDGSTPLHLLAYQGELTLKDLKVRYPWFPFKKGVEVKVVLIDEILNTSNAEQFILKL